MPASQMSGLADPAAVGVKAMSYSVPKVCNIVSREGRLPQGLYSPDKYFEPACN